MTHVIIIILILPVAVALYVVLPGLLKIFLRRRFLNIIKGTGGICLTFDDGPHAESTPQILELLRQFGAKATFFVVGENVEKNPLLAHRIVEMGNDVGEHGYRHKFPWKTGPLGSIADMIKTRKVVKMLSLPDGPILHRPPFGKLNLITFLYIWLTRRKIVFWNINPEDYNHNSAEEVARHVIDRLVPGSVILLHDGRTGNGSNVSVTVSSLKLILEEAKRREMSFCTVRELLKLNQPAHIKS